MTAGAARKPVSPAISVRRREVADARERAQLRASYAARVSAQAAAGRRRFAIFIAASVLLFVVGALAIASVVSPWWLGVPAALLAANIIGSRFAALQNEKANAAYRERLAKLGPQRVAPLPVRVAESAPVEVLSETESGEDAQADAAEVVAVEEPSPSLPPVSEPVEWEVRALPTPTYLDQQRVVRRSIRVDTDINGIPQIVAAVPGRPITASALPSESAPATFTFDLNAVLEARRAQ